MSGMNKASILFCVPGADRRVWVRTGGLTGQNLLLLLSGRGWIQEVGEDGGERVGGQRLGAVRLPQQVERDEPLGRAGQQVRLLEQHDQNRAHPEMLCFAEVMVEVRGEAFEGAGTSFLRDDAQEVGQLLRGERHGSRRF